MPPRDSVRQFLRRFLPESDIKPAIHSVTMAASGQAQLTIAGPGDMLPIAEGLHARWRPSEPRPFVVCDPRRRTAGADARSPANVEFASEAIERARGGTLCLRSTRFPASWQKIVRYVRTHDDISLIILCDVASNAGWVMWLRRNVKPQPIVIPSQSQLNMFHVIREFFYDAIHELCALPGCIEDDDVYWVMSNIIDLSDIPKACKRIVALRRSKNVTHAAIRLCMAPVSLARWMSRHHIPRDGMLDRVS